MNNIERKFTALKEFSSLDEGPGGFEGYGNDTGILDSYDDIVLPGAYANLAEFIHHGWTAPDHAWGVKDEIGIITDAREDARGLFFRSEFHPTADAQQVRAKAKNRLAKGKFVALSIGYEVLEDRYVTGYEAIQYVKNPTPEIIARLKATPRVRLLIKIKLYEVSIVSVGANSNSEATAVKSAPAAGEKGAFADAAATASHRTMMVGVFLAPEAAHALAIEGGEPAEDLHVTLAYCGDVTTMPDLAIAEAMVAVKNLTSWKALLTGRINGYGVFKATGNSDGKDVFYAGVDMPGLAELHCALKYVLAGAGTPAREDHGFVPHVTLQYLDAGAPLPAALPDTIALRFDALTITVGDERTVVPLTGCPMTSGSPYMYLGLDTNDPQVKEIFAADEATHAELKFADHSERTLAAVEEFIKRAKQIQELRTKEGRAISAARRARMEELQDSIADARDALGKVEDDIGEMLAESEPKPKGIKTDERRKMLLEVEMMLEGVTQ